MENSGRYEGLEKRILVDFSNDCPFTGDNSDVLILQRIGGNVKNFEGQTVTFYEGEYLYLCELNYEGNGEADHIFGEGYVISNPCSDKPFAWCCKLIGAIEYSSDYNKRFGR